MVTSRRVHDPTPRGHGTTTTTLRSMTRGNGRTESTKAVTPRARAPTQGIDHERHRLHDEDDERDATIMNQDPHSGERTRGSPCRQLRPRAQMRRSATRGATDTRNSGGAGAIPVIVPGDGVDGLDRGAHDRRIRRIEPGMSPPPGAAQAAGGTTRLRAEDGAPRRRRRTATPRCPPRRQPPPAINSTDPCQAHGPCATSHGRSAVDRPTRGQHRGAPKHRRSAATRGENGSGVASTARCTVTARPSAASTNGAPIASRSSSPPASVNAPITTPSAPSPRLPDVAHDSVRRSSGS